MTRGRRSRNPEGAERCRMPTKLQQQGLTVAQRAAIAQDHLHSMLQGAFVVQQYAMRNDEPQHRIYKSDAIVQIEVGVAVLHRTNYESFPRIHG